MRKSDEYKAPRLWPLQLLLAATFIIASACSSRAATFDDLFAEATLRVDVSLGGHGPDKALSIDSVAQWPGWYGRRVNLSHPQYPETLQVAVIDCATADTIYVDTKYMDPPHFFDPTAVTHGTLFVPKPKAPADIEVSRIDYGPDGRPHRNFRCLHLSADDLKALHNRVCTPAVPWKTLHEAGDPKHCINLAIMAEGYTRAEMQKFLAQAAVLDSVLFSQPAFREHKADFNVVAVMLPSPESGISRPSKDIRINSALHAHFDSFNLDRLVTVPDTRPMWDALEGIPAAHILILANTDTYGGSGPYNEYAIASAGRPDFASIIIHEFGHSFASLGDEYEAGYSIQYTPDVEPMEPNITTLHDFSGKWQPLIESGEASLIEGAGYQSHGVWRGCDHCLMRSITDLKFCPVCARAISQTIAFYTAQTTP